MRKIPARTAEAPGRTPRVPDHQRYEIRVTGRLASRWATFFDGMTLTPQDDGTTVIHGPVADQAALHGLLRKLGDLSLHLVSVEPAAAEARADPTTDPSSDRSAGPPPERSTT